MSKNELSRLPTRAKTHLHEDESRRLFREFFSDPHFISRGETDNDYGVDCIVEALVDGGASPSNMRTHAQLKSTSKELNSDGSLSYSVAASNLSYLLNVQNSFYATHHQPSGEIYWKFAHDVYAEANESGKDWGDESVTIRSSQTLDQSGIRAIHEAVVEYGRVDREMRLQQPSNAAVLASLKASAKAASLANELDAALGILISEAIRHYEDGLSHYRVEKLGQARLSFDRAIGLFRASGPEPSLRGKILVSAASVCILLHDQIGAERHLRAVDELLGGAEINDRLREVAAVALEQRAVIAASRGEWNDDIRSMFAKAAAHFGAVEDYFNQARSIHIAAESALQARRPEQAHAILEPFFDALDKISDVSVSTYMTVLGLATMASIKLMFAAPLATSDPHCVALVESATESFRKVLEFASGINSADLRLKTELSLVKCFWFMGQHDKAIETSEGFLTPQTLAAFPREYMFGEFNLALINREAGRAQVALDIFCRLRPLFDDSGDAETVSQVDRYIVELRRELDDE